MYTQDLATQPGCVGGGLGACLTECEDGDADACLAASTAYRDDRSTFIRLNQRACTLGSPQGCSAYAGHLAGGSDEDRTTAYHLWDRACDDGYEPACRAGAISRMMSTAIYTPDPPAAELAQTHAARENLDVLVRIHFCVGPDGTPLRVDVSKSSGDADIDAICSATVQTWQFEPYDEDTGRDPPCATQVFEMHFRL